MASGLATLDSMPRKKLTPEEIKERAPTLGVRLRGDLTELVRELARKNRRTFTAEISIALENHLSQAGMWPPPEKKS